MNQQTYVLLNGLNQYPKLTPSKINPTFSYNDSWNNILQTQSTINKYFSTVIQHIQLFF